MNEFMLIHAENVVMICIILAGIWGGYRVMLKPLTDEKVKKAQCISKLNGRLTYVERKLDDVERKMDNNKKTILDRMERLEEKLDRLLEHMLKP